MFTKGDPKWLRISHVMVLVMAAVTRSALFFFFEHTKNVDSLTTALAPMPLGPTSRTRAVSACMTRRQPVAECRVETNRLHANVLTGHKVSPDPTRQKARHSKWNYSETDATKSHRWRMTKSAPIGTPLTPWRPRTDTNNVTTYLTPHGVFVRIAGLESCVAATNAMIHDELAKQIKKHNIPLFGRETAVEGPNTFKVQYNLAVHNFHSGFPR